MCVYVTVCASMCAPMDRKNGNYTPPPTTTDKSHIEARPPLYALCCCWWCSLYAASVKAALEHKTGQHKRVSGRAHTFPAGMSGSGLNYDQQQSKEKEQGEGRDSRDKRKINKTHTARKEMITGRREGSECKSERARKMR